MRNNLCAVRRGIIPNLYIAHCTLYIVHSKKLRADVSLVFAAYTYRVRSRLESRCPISSCNVAKFLKCAA